ncbi:MAG: histone deacetylase [Spirochaetaceae bacterium]|nr:MAG: histone deacetylase [Spirochaetaceae bacterium]
MIVYDSESHISLGDYGILIPVAPDRSARVLSEIETRLAARGISRDQWLASPEPVELTRGDILRVHSPEYVERLYGPELEQAVLEAFELIDDQGKPHRYAPETAVRSMHELFASMLRWTARSYQAGVEALSNKGRFCYHLGGGAHHGHYAFGHGFCIVNDIVVSIRKLQAEHAVRTAWVIDLDAHKGDGTAALTQGDESVTTVSIHMAAGWPLDLPEIGPTGVPHPSYIASDYDIPVAAGEEAEYLPRLEAALAALDSRDKPDVAYVVGGVDPYEHDGLPSTQSLRLTLEQLVARDAMTFDFLRDRGIPQAWLMAGGYGERAWEPYVPSIEYAVVHSLGLSD